MYPEYTGSTSGRRRWRAVDAMPSAQTSRSQRSSPPPLKRTVTSSASSLKSYSASAKCMDRCDRRSSSRAYNANQEVKR
jgi:hypothetical protein